MAISVPPAPSEQATKLADDYIAGEVISALRAVTLNANQEVFLGQKNTVYSEAKVLGISTTAAVAGNTVNVQTFGILDDPSFNFPLNDPLFLDNNGFITNVPPVPGEFLVEVGNSLGAGSIFVRVQEPTELT